MIKGCLWRRPEGLLYSIRRVFGGEGTSYNAAERERVQQQQPRASSVKRRASNLSLSLSLNLSLIRNLNERGLRAFNQRKSAQLGLFPIGGIPTSTCRLQGMPCFSKRATVGMHEMHENDGMGSDGWELEDWLANSLGLDCFWDWEQRTACIVLTAFSPPSQTLHSTTRARTRVSFSSLRSTLSLALLRR